VDNRVTAVRLVSSKFAREASIPDRLLIKDLVLPARIGVHAHEKGAPQRVRINAVLEIDDQAVPTDDDISKVVSYEHVVTRIKALTAGEHINLVETLAEKIAEICLADRRVERARITVEKLDVEPDAAAVGIEIVRRR